MLVSRVWYFVLLVLLCNPCHAYKSGNVPEKDENKKFHEWHRNLACEKIYIDKCIFVETTDRLSNNDSIIRDKDKKNSGEHRQ